MTHRGAAAGRCRRLAAAIVTALLAIAVVTGCTVSHPDDQDWRELVQQSLEDVRSEVATARLAMVQARDGRLPAAYAEVALVDAESAVSTAEESLSTVQPPPGRGDQTDRLLDLIGGAGDAVRAARQAAADAEFGDRPVLSDLDDCRRAIDRRLAALGVVAETDPDGLDRLDQQVSPRDQQVSLRDRQVSLRDRQVSPRARPVFPVGGR